MLHILIDLIINDERKNYGNDPGSSSVWIDNNRSI